MFLFAAVFLVLSVYFVSTSKTQQKFKLPPGPRSIPIIGNFHWHAKFPWKHFVNYRKIYGPIVCLKLGKQRLVLLNEIAAWKEAFCRPEFSRFSSNLFASILENKSIIFGDDVAGSSKDSGFLGRQSPLLWIPFMSKLFPSISTNEIMKKWLFKLLQTMKERIRHQAKTRQNSEVRNITDAYFDKEEELRTNSKSFFYGGNTQHFVYSGLSNNVFRSNVKHASLKSKIECNNLCLKDTGMTLEIMHENQEFPKNAQVDL
ncbi:unnamed protein product [Allacma fusca]|uniref:Cytochrome P450 n=1 Tax=Allacma fusca TaxID=39272 RepID=A0A8J2J0Z0_9HEXA|nr:unnamed protein product [Allacma fusca]